MDKKYLDNVNAWFYEQLLLKRISQYEHDIFKSKWGNLDFENYLNYIDFSRQKEDLNKELIYEVW